MTTPLVSVLLPVCNGAPTLARAIASVQGQDLPDWELVVVENGSVDATRQILGQLGATDRRIQILNNPQPDLVAALHTGLAHCRGEFIARMDADDEMQPQRLSAQVAALRAHPDWGLVGCRVRFGGNQAAQAGYADHVRWLNEQMSPDEIWRRRFVESPLAHPSVMWRRSVGEQHGAYRAGDFPEDYELWLRWMDAGVRMGKIADEMLTWYDSAFRLSRTDPRYRSEAFYRIKAGFIARELERSGEGREVWIAGAGRTARRRAAELEQHGVAIVGYVDVDPRKVGQRIGNRPVVSPDELPAPNAAVVLSYVGSRGAREKVRGMLEGQRRSEGDDYWLCA